MRIVEILFGQKKQHGEIVSKRKHGTLKSRVTLAGFRDSRKLARKIS